MKNVLFVKHIPIEGPGELEGFLRKNKIPTINLELYEEDLYLLSVNLDEIMAVVILGGSMNVYEENRYPFLKWEDGFIKEALKKNIPLFGICLGAQLIAKAAGAEVFRAAEKELGWYEVELTAEGQEDGLFKNAPDKLPVFQWHEDTFGLPDEAVLLAKANNLNQAFRIGKAYGLQFHLEMNAAMIKEWIDFYFKENKGGYLKMLDEFRRLKADFEGQQDLIFHNLLALILPKK